MNDECMEERLQKEHYHLAFTGGGCWHFALEVKKRLGNKGTFAGLVNQRGGYYHVWIETSSHAIDVTGVTEREVFRKQLLKRYELPDQYALDSIREIDEDVILKESRSSRFSKEMNNRLRQIASDIIEREEKYSRVRM